MKHSVFEFLSTPLATGEEVETLEVAVTSTKAAGRPLLLFSYGQDRYAIDALSVKAVVRQRELTQIPFVRSSYCRGFVAYDGCTIPVADIPSLTHSTDSFGIDPSQKLLIIDHLGLKTALSISSVEGMRTVEPQNASTKKFGSLTIQELSLDGKVVAFVDARQITNALGEPES